MISPNILPLVQATPSYLANSVMVQAYFAQASIPELLVMMQPLFLYALVSFLLGTGILYFKMKREE